MLLVGKRKNATSRRPRPKSPTFSLDNQEKHRHKAYLYWTKSVFRNDKNIIEKSFSNDRREEKRERASHDVTMIVRSNHCKNVSELFQNGPQHSHIDCCLFHCCKKTN